MSEVHAVANPLPLRLGEVFRRSRWDHVVILTYTFDLPFFESHLLPLLINGNAESIAVAADARWLSERLPKWIKSGDVRHAGRSYTLSGVHTAGTFHPKVVLAVGESRGMVMVGSGNISAFGMSTGGELFSVIEWSDDDAPEMAREAWRACLRIADVSPIDPLFRERVRNTTHASVSLTGPAATQHLLHNVDEPILDQLARRVGSEKVDELVLWSPFWDHQLRALSELVERLKPSKVTLGLQPRLTSIDPDRLRSVTQQHRDVTWSFVELCTSGPMRRSVATLIHAKGLLIRHTSGREVLLAGSPNISTPALLETSATGNTEIATVTVGMSLREQVFSEDGPIQLGNSVDILSLEWKPHDPVEPVSTAPRALTLLSAVLDGTKLTLHVHGDLPATATAILDGTIEVPLRLVGAVYLTELEPDHNPMAAVIRWSDREAGPVIVANLRQLASVGAKRTSANRVPLTALDFGGDEEIRVILDELAKLAIISAHDIDRIMRGSGPPSEQEEAAEAGSKAPPVDLSSIDFSQIAQHPRSFAYRDDTDVWMETPRIQLLLDEVVQQFNSLRQRHLLSLVQPAAGEGDDTETDPEPILPIQRWTVSARIAVRVRNRIKRYIRGVGDRRFRSLITPEWMAKNYSLFLQFLYLLWNRAIDSRLEEKATILGEAELGRHILDLFTSFWGSDEQQGYLATLSEDDQYEVALILTEYHSDALTIALADSLVRSQGELGRSAPFVVAQLAEMSDRLGLLTPSAADAALVYLRETRRSPGEVVQSIRSTVGHFTWVHFFDALARRYHVRKVELRATGYVSGDTLVVTASVPITNHDRPVALLADWVRTSLDQGETRVVFQLQWHPGDDVLIFDRIERDLLWRAKGPAGPRTRVIASDIDIDGLAVLSRFGPNQDQDQALVG